MVFLGVLASIFLSGSASGSVVVYRTVVSLTFDDGRESQSIAGDLLASHGMHATFYVSSGFTDDPGPYFLNWDQVAALAADGNEIGGHTLTHRDLTTLPLDQVRAEVCGDLNTIRNHGFDVTSFAYPGGASNSEVEAIVTDCGYTSARITQGIGTAGWCETAHCPTAETIPPWNPYNIRATGSVATTTTLAELESFVTSAEQNGGGWVPFVFHDVGNGTDAYSISETDFADFLGWLSLRQSRGTIVRTVDEVMSGAVNPPPSGPNLLQNPSFENDTNVDGLPDCWTTTSWGTSSGSWTETGDAHISGIAVKGEITLWTDGGRRFMVDHSSECAPPVTPGHTYRLTGWYKGTLSPYLAVFWDNGSGSFSLGSAESPDFPASSDWHAFSWTTPPAPAGTTALSIALTIGGATGDITIDDFTLGDAAGTPPDLQISAPAAGGYVSGSTVTLSANASDGEGVQNVEFFVDDQPIDTDASSPYSVSWNSTTASEGTHTLTALATDQDGAQSYDSLSFVVDNTDPTGNLTAPTAGSFLRGTVTLESNSSDTGSGVASVSFERSPAGQNSWTEIGSDTTSPYSVSWNTAPTDDGLYDLRVVTTDGAGNSRASNTVSVTVDNTAPVVSFDSKPNGPTSSAGASFAFSVFDGNSTNTLCSLDGAAYESCYSPQDYTGLSDREHTFSVEAIDSASNEGETGWTWTVDTMPPSGSLTAPAPGSFLRGTVALGSDSSDDRSGVASVVFQSSPAGEASWTTIGSDTSSPYGASWDTAAVADGSYDLRALTTDQAANSFASAAVTVTVDNTAPSGSLTRPGPNVFVTGRIKISSDSADATSGVATVAFQTAPTRSGTWRTAASVAIAPWSASLDLGNLGRGSHYLRAVTVDRAGNVFTSPARKIRLDSTAPTSSIVCKRKRCGSQFAGRVKVVIRARDGGSGVRAIRYTLNGKRPTASSRLFKRPLTLAATRRIRWRVWDKVGNASPFRSQLIRVKPKCSPHGSCRSGTSRG